MSGEYPERFERVLWMVLYMFFFGLPFITIVLIGADKDTFDLSPLLIVFIGKLPIFGIHYWLPKAHRYATAVGRIVLAGLILKVAIYGFFLISPFSFDILLSVRLVGGLIARLQVLYVCDIKTIIAVSRVAHICYVGVIVRLNSELTVLACSLIALGHGVRAASLFGISTSIYSYIARRRWYKWGFCGVFGRIYLFVWFIASGFPFSLNFFGELLHFFILSSQGGILWAFFFGGMAILSGIIAALVTYATYNLKGNLFIIVEEVKGYIRLLSLYFICLFF